MWSRFKVVVAAENASCPETMGLSINIHPPQNGGILNEKSNAAHRPFGCSFRRAQSGGQPRADQGGALATRLGLEQPVDETVRLVGGAGGAKPGRKILTLVHTLVAGGSHIGLFPLEWGVRAG